MAPTPYTPKKAKRESRTAPVREGWQAECLAGRGGELAGNLANAMIALRSDPAWSGVLVFDEMRGGVRLLKAVPSPQATGRDFVARSFGQDDLLRATEWLQLNGLPGIGVDTVANAVDLAAREQPVHLVRAYLRSLKWDGEPRLDTAWSRYFGVSPIPGDVDRKVESYHQLAFRMFLIAMVARVERPGCQVDHVLVLQGGQGFYKSSVGRVLAGDDFFSDALPADLDAKDAALHLAGKWLVELAELHALNRSSPAALKAFVTRRIDRVRPPYARAEIETPRQNIFLGTTNRAEFIKDTTGGRRWWPVEVGRIDLDALARDRDQLFAEAVELYREGQPWWPDADLERDIFAPEQERRQAVDPWEPLIAAYIAGRRNVTVTEILRDAIGLSQEKMATTQQRRVAGIMEALGWRRGPRGPAGQRFWYPPAAADG